MHEQVYTYTRLSQFKLSCQLINKKMRLPERLLIRITIGHIRRWPNVGSSAIYTVHRMSEFLTKQ
jgi:hypothetical protein